MLTALQIIINVLVLLLIKKL